MSGTSIRSNAVNGANAIGVHPYSENKIGEPEGRWRHLLRGRLMIAQEMGSQALPLRITEWGFTTPGLDANGDGHSAQSRQAQAIRVARSYLTWIVVGPIQYWYFNLVDLCDDAHDVHCNLGLMTFNFQEKPSMKSLQILSSTVLSRTYMGILRQSSVLPWWLNVARFNGASDHDLRDLVFGFEYQCDSVALPDNGSAINMYGAPIAGGGAALRLFYADGPIYVRVPNPI